MEFGDSFEDIMKIFNSFSEEDKYLITDDNFEDKSLVKYQKVLYFNGEPISFFELYVPKNFVREGYVVIGTKEEYRNMGYSKILIKKVEEELKDLFYNKLYWMFRGSNEISKHMAISMGYKHLKGNIYVKNIK